MFLGEGDADLISDFIEFPKQTFLLLNFSPFFSLFYVKEFLEKFCYLSFHIHAKYHLVLAEIIGKFVIVMLLSIAQKIAPICAAFPRLQGYPCPLCVCQITSHSSFEHDKGHSKEVLQFSLLNVSLDLLHTSLSSFLFPPFWCCSCYLFLR